MAGTELRSGRPISKALSILVTCGLLVISGLSIAQALYKYRGADGEWIYTDRPPDGQAPAEIRDLPTGAAKPSVVVSHRIESGTMTMTANNRFYAPVEVVVALDEVQNLSFPPADQQLRWVVPARSSQTLLELPVLDEGVPADLGYRYLWLRGDPATVHEPDQPYRAPFAVATEFRVSQAFPSSMTHVTADSYHAVDFAMPIGTDVYAARGGTVFEVASTNFQGGLDPDRHLPAANLVRIMHDDGSYAVYAHLNWNTIRVQPGDRVQRGEYIADSGNTGFSSGPHLHFAVLQNKGMRVESVPVVFSGPNDREVQATSGENLVAY